MSSFGDWNIKTRIEQALSPLTQEYSDNFDEDLEAQRQFMLDVLECIRYICGEY